MKKFLGRPLESTLYPHPGTRFKVLMEATRRAQRGIWAQKAGRWVCTSHSYRHFLDEQGLWTYYEHHDLGWRRCALTQAQLGELYEAILTQNYE